jgi:hypothetical protein
VKVVAVVDGYAPEGVALLPLYLTADPVPFEPVVGTIERAAVAVAAG